MTKKKLFPKSTKANKNIHVSSDKTGRFSFSKSSKVAALLFAVAFGAIGGIYLLSSRAAAPNHFTVEISVVNTANQPLKGTVVNTFFCNPLIVVINSNNQDFTCNWGSATITAIALSGYHVSPNSQVKVNTILANLTPHNGQVDDLTGTITMESNQASPAPAPAPAAAPAPAPAAAPAAAPATPAKASSSSSSSSSRTTSAARTSTPVATTSTPAANPAPIEEVADTTTNSTSEEQLDSGFTTNVPKGKAATLTSYDDQVKVSFPKGVFDTDAYCSIDTADDENVPVKSEDLIGPYGLNCVDGEGNTLDELKEDVTVTFNLPSEKTTYIAYTHSDKWTEAAKGKGKTLGVKLSKQELFAAAPAKTTNWVSIIIDIVAIIVALLIIGGIIRLIKRRQRQDSVPTTTAEEFYQDYTSAQGGQQPPSGQDQGQNPGGPPPPPPPQPPQPPLPPAGPGPAA